MRLLRFTPAVPIIIQFSLFSSHLGKPFSMAEYIKINIWSTDDFSCLENDKLNQVRHFSHL